MEPEIDLKRLKELLTMYGEQITAEMLTRLAGFGKIASGSLRDSINFGINETPGTLELVFGMAHYGDFVDKGVNGRERGYGSPFTFRTGPGGGPNSESGKSIRAWCRIKGIPEDAAYPIARNIGRFGIPATHFFTLPFARRKQALINDIKNLMSEDVQNKIREYLNKTT